jgi:hypothetical protein
MRLCLQDHHQRHQQQLPHLTQATPEVRTGPIVAKKEAVVRPERGFVQAVRLASSASREQHRLKGGEHNEQQQHWQAKG